MCSLVCTKICKLDIWVSKKFTFFVLKHVKCVYKDDVLYDNQLIITRILVRRFTPGSMWIKCIDITLAIMHFIKISLNKANKLNK